MKAKANPVSVDFFIIETVGPLEHNGFRQLQCSEGKAYSATPEMMSRMTPAPGDYVVIQEDGYVYLNPKAVFERKYSPVNE